MSSQTPKSFESLQEDWYGRLELDGFVDIEDHKQEGRPLKRWSGFSMKRTTLDRIISQPANASIVSSWPESHLENARAFLNNPEFLALCESVCKHKNNAVASQGAWLIWTLHCEGRSTRAIEESTGVDHVTVFRVIKRLSAWMNLMEIVPE